jgi:uncharacterized protein YecT (DUF1311 family)
MLRTAFPFRLSAPSAGTWLRAAALVLALGLSPWSSAQAAATIDCDKAETDDALLVCAKQDYTLAVARLKEAATQTRASLPPQAKTLFDASNQAWETFRDADCRWNAYDVGNGSLSELILATCLADLTLTRMEEIEAGLGAQ